MDRKQFLNEMTAVPDFIKREDIMKFIDNWFGDNSEAIGGIPNTPENDRIIALIFDEALKNVVKRIKESKTICTEKEIPVDLKQVRPRPKPKAAEPVKKQAIEDEDWQDTMDNIYKQDRGWQDPYDGTYEKVPSKYPSKKYYTAEQHDVIKNMQEELDSMDKEDVDPYIKNGNEAHSFYSKMAGSK